MIKGSKIEAGSKIYSKLHKDEPAQEFTVVSIIRENGSLNVKLIDANGKPARTSYLAEPNLGLVHWPLKAMDVDFPQHAAEWEAGRAAKGGR